MIESSEENSKGNATEKQRLTFQSEGQSSSRDEISSSEETVDKEDAHSNSSAVEDGSGVKTVSHIILEKILDLQKQVSIEKIGKEYDSELDQSYLEECREKISSIFMKPRFGISKHLSALFIIIVVTGNRIIYLPYALRESGFPGVFMFLLCGLNSFYCGLLIGWCRTMVQERWSECDENLPTPYPVIGLKAAGKWMQYTVHVMLTLSLLISGIEILNSTARTLDESTHPEIYCTLMIIFAAILVPLTWIDKLRDLWFVVLFEIAITVLFVVMLLILIFLDKRTYGQVKYHDKTVGSLLHSFGMISFLLSSSGIFPSIQDDMLHRNLFSQSVGLGYLIIFMLYLPLPIIGYAAYGEDTDPNILHNLRNNFNLKQPVTFLETILALKLLGTFLIKLNPLFISIEDQAKLPSAIGYKKYLIRSCTVLIILILGLGIRPFVRVVELIEITLLNFLTFLFPVIFYICLVFQGASSKQYRRRISKKHWLMLIEILVVSISGGIAAIYVSRNELELKSFSNCFTDFFIAENRSCLFC